MLFIWGRYFLSLRANDLVYGPAVRSYLLGEKPPAFDLLYWNGDSPNLPGKMAMGYLKNLYRDNQLARGVFEVGGQVVNMSDIDIPIYVVAAKSDHIAQWRPSFKGLNRTTSKSARFILAGSGHIAGVVNPPTKVKYGYWSNPDRPDSCTKWLADAKAHEGSWWPDWASWLGKQSGAKKRDAMPPGGPDHKPIEPAPGSYVKK